MPDDNSPISAAEAKRLFADWKAAPAIVLAVSGGPDSIALMWLAARWRRALARGPRLVAVTVDHGLRAEAAREAREVKRLARSLDLPHRTMRWTGAKPKTGLPAAARAARYRCWRRRRGPRRHPYPHRAYPRRSGRDAADAAVARQRHRRSGGDGAAVASARRAAGAPVSAMFPNRSWSRPSKKPGSALPTIRPTATSHFTRPRIRAIMPVLAAEGGDARNLARLASRLGPGQCGGGSPGRRRRALSGARGIARRVADAGLPAKLIRCRALPPCRRKSACGCCCVRSIGSVMRGRRNLARSRPCWRHWTGPAQKAARAGSAEASQRG